MFAKAAAVLKPSGMAADAFVSASVGSVMVSVPTVSGAGMVFLSAAVILAGDVELPGHTAVLKGSDVAFVGTAAVAAFVSVSVGSVVVDASVAMPDAVGGTRGVLPFLPFLPFLFFLPFLLSPVAATLIFRLIRMFREIAGFAASSASGFPLVVCQGRRASLRSAVACFSWSSIDLAHLSFCSLHDCSGPQVVTLCRIPKPERLILVLHTFRHGRISHGLATEVRPATSSSSG